MLLLYVLSAECVRYENKGVQWLRSRHVGPVGLSPNESSSQFYAQSSALSAGCGIPSAETATEGMSKAAKKNMKRREKKKEKMANETHVVDPVADNVQTMTLSTVPVSEPVTSTNHDEKQKENIRQLRSLRKKLKQIVELQARLDAGEKLETEQLEKIGRREAIEEEMEYLEMEIANS